MSALEKTILRNLLTNEDFTRTVIPFLKTSYFDGNPKAVFREIVDFVAKYNSLPTRESLSISIEESERLSESQVSEAIAYIPDLFTTEVVEQKWLLDKTEKWCQERALFLSIMESIKVLEGNHEKYTKDALPDLLKDALAVSFDKSVGHDYIGDAAARFEYYKREEERLPFDIEVLNEITRGGLVKKSLTCFMAGTGVGKTIMKCHLASAALAMGFNVLYITMEMAEEKIAERIDANLLNVPIQELPTIENRILNDKFGLFKQRTTGNLIIKEYPTSQANANHFRALLNELELKKKFKPDIIFIDYLNICASSRIKAMGGTIGSYGYVKSIAEEIRGLAVEFNVPVVTSTQVNRAGFGSDDPSLENTSESFGLPATADLMIALISTEELQEQGRIMCKQLKNRYNDVDHKRKFLLGIDKSVMRLFDVVDTGEGINDDIPVFDATSQHEDAQKFVDFKI